MNNNNHNDKISTLILLDWDDTLFPTSWVMRHNINLLNSYNKWKYIPVFKELDKTLYSFLQNLKQYGKILIITNATADWINCSVSVLPKTKPLIDTIKIISARELFESKYSDMMEWKKNTFKYVIGKEIHNNNKLMNIISIGDADYEYRALIDLYRWNRKNKKLLKSIKLMNNPSQKMLIDQLVVLNKAIPDICTKSKHIDWNFRRI